MTFLTGAGQSSQGSPITDAVLPGSGVFAGERILAGDLGGYLLLGESQTGDARNWVASGLNGAAAAPPVPGLIAPAGIAIAMATADATTFSVDGISTSKPGPGGPFYEASVVRAAAEASTGGLYFAGGFDWSHVPVGATIVWVRVKEIDIAQEYEGIWRARLQRPIPDPPATNGPEYSLSTPVAALQWVDLGPFGQDASGWTRADLTALGVRLKYDATSGPFVGSLLARLRGVTLEVAYEVQS